MYKEDIKEGIFAVVFGISNMIIAFTVTSILGISNIIIYKSYTTTLGDVTWESLIWIILGLAEALFYEWHINRKIENCKIY